MPYMPCPWVIIIENKEEQGITLLSRPISRKLPACFHCPRATSLRASSPGVPGGTGVEEGKEEGAPREILPAGYQATTLFFNSLTPKYLYTNSSDQSPRMHFSL